MHFELVWCWLQEKAAKQCLEQQAQHAGGSPLLQQQSPVSSCPEAGAAPEPTLGAEQSKPGSSAGGSVREQGAPAIEEHLAGTLPLFRIPGLAVVLPTTAGHVDFAPLFLSKEQLDITWVRGSCLCTLVPSKLCISEGLGAAPAMWAFTPSVILTKNLQTT